MSPLFAIAPALPLGQAGKYVAAAYIVVFVLILAYVGIMARRAQRTQRELDELRRDVEAATAAREELADGDGHVGDRRRGGGHVGDGRTERSERVA